MDDTIGIVNNLSNIDRLYEKVFRKKGMKEFTKLIWFNIKDDFDNLPTDTELFFRVLIEKIVIYTIILEDENGYRVLKKEIAKRNTKIKVKSYDEMSAYYREHIEKAQKFLEQHPNIRKKLL